MAIATRRSLLVLATVGTTAAALAAAAGFATETSWISKRNGGVAAFHHNTKKVRFDLSSARRRWRVVGSGKDWQLSAAAKGNDSTPKTAMERGTTTVVEQEGEETAVGNDRSGVLWTDDKEQMVPDSVMSTMAEALGSVDEDRLVFPELASGEVTRLFSNLQYDKQKDGRVTAALHAAGSTVGATALVAGTTVGAGILALPAATVSSGFVPSTLALGVAWISMVLSGLLVAELSMNRIGETGRPGVGLLEMYENSLGPWGGRLGSASYFFLHYAMMVAYISQGGSNVEALVHSVVFGGADTNLPMGTGQVLFAGLCGLALFVSPPAVLEQANNVLVLGVVLSFVGILAIGASTADYGALVAPANQHFENVVGTFPILFLALVFQNVVPTIVTQLEGDRQKITTAITAGTGIPFVMFILWNAVILGNVLGLPTGDGAATSHLDPVRLLQQQQADGSWLAPLVACFSQLAITTSLIGFVYGLIDAWTDVLNIPTGGPKFQQWKPALYAAVLLPPLAVFASGDADIFYNALEYGGAFGVSTLFLWLPPLMVWKERFAQPEKQLTVKPMAPLGKLSLTFLWTAATTLIVQQGLEKMGILE